MKNFVFGWLVFLFAALIPSFAHAQATAAALDGPGFVWFSVGDNPHGAPTTVATNTHDGVDAWMSANRCAPTEGTCANDNKRNILRTTVIGPGTLKFWWRVSSEEGFDWFSFYVGGYLVTEPEMQISGVGLPWMHETVLIPEGTQTVEWVYSKDESVSEGADRGWVDEVYFFPGPPVITNQPTDEILVAPVGATISFSVGYQEPGYPSPFNSSNPAPNAQKSVIWQFNGTNLIGRTNDILTLTNVQLNQSGEYRVTITNIYGKATSEVAVLQVFQPILLEWGLDTTNLVWTTSGDANWFGISDSSLAHDGIDAVRSGIPFEDENNELLSFSSHLQTTIVGPGVIKFWWRLAGLETDQFYVTVAGVIKTNAPNEDGEWQEETIGVPSGSRIVKFTYFRDDFISTDESDAGYLDEFRFIPATNAPPRFSFPSFSKEPDEDGLAGFSAVITHDPSRTYRVQFSTNLTTWSDIATFNTSDAHYYFNHPGATNFSRRYYRVVTP